MVAEKWCCWTKKCQWRTSADISLIRDKFWLPTTGWTRFEQQCKANCEVGTQPKVSQGSYHNIQLTNLCMILRLTKLFIAYSQRLAYWHIMDLAAMLYTTWNNLIQIKQSLVFFLLLLYLGYNIAHNIQHCPALPCTWWPWAQACSVSRMPLSCHVPFQHWQPLQLPSASDTMHSPFSLPGCALQVPAALLHRQISCIYCVTTIFLYIFCISVQFIHCCCNAAWQFSDCVVVNYHYFYSI